MHIHRILVQTLVVLVAGLFPAPQATAQADPAPDLLSFANGVLPVSITTSNEAMAPKPEAAISAIDGNPVGFIVTKKPGADGDAVEVIYALPAPTRFTRFAVPGIFETPSPSQTFFRRVEISGASASVDGPYVPLADGELGVHAEKGMETEVPLASDQPEVSWVKLRLSGGISVERDQTFFEFSEIIGNGTQQAPPLSEGFSGNWKGRGVKIELSQEAATVNGCYDTDGKLAGTVSGNVLRALGRNEAGIASQFILIAGEDGALHGLRSTNGAPFKPYDGAASDKTVCEAPEPPSLGCGAVLHGIGFDYDSDVIRPESQVIIASLFDGLSAESSSGIEIVGHSSSEGAADYNRDLSQRRAQSVVDALVGLGLDAARISASGRGEEEPIASNEDEAGRSLNRRVEVRCAG